MPALPPSSDFTGASVTEGGFKTAIGAQRAFLAGLLGTDGTVAAALAAIGALGAGYLAKASAYTVTTADRGRTIGASGTWTLGLPAAATAGEGFMVALRNTGSGTITVDPNGAETINGVTTLAFGPQAGSLIVCTGSAWITVGLTPQTSDLDTTAGRALLAGAGGLLNPDNAPVIADFDGTPATGLYRYLGAAADGKPDASAFHGTVLVQNAQGARAYWAVRAATAGEPRAWVGKRNTGVDSDPVWNEIVLVDTAGLVTLAGGRITLNGNKLGGDEVSIADDAAATLTPPRTGGFALITCAGGSASPRAQNSRLIWFDAGTDLAIEGGPTWSAVGTEVNVTTGNVTGTTGTDGRVTVAVQSGVLKIENRTGATRSFQVTWL